MNMQNSKRLLSFILCIVLIAATVLTCTGCHDNPQTTVSVSDNDVQKTVVGEGKTTFSFSVTDPNGKVTAFEVHTDEKTVGAALLKLQLIDGEDGQYGLYVKTVNGNTLDYNKDGKYWAFYEDGEYAALGVDQTDIKAGVHYAFKAE